MKTQEWVMIGVVVLVMLFVFFGHGRQPFQALKEEDLARATVRLTPPDVKMEVENREKLAELLRNVVFVVAGICFLVPLNYVYFRKRKDLFVN